MEHNDREGFMPLASNNERTATVEVTRPSERLVSPFHGSERLMTLLELSQLLGVPVATLYLWRHRGEGSTGYRMFDTGGRLWRRGSRRRPIGGPLVVRSVRRERRAGGAPAIADRTVERGLKTFDRRIVADRCWPACHSRWLVRD